MGTLQVDYDGVAARYDAHPDRARIPIDLWLGDCLRTQVRGQAPFRLLDLACGTGNYLAQQARHYPYAAAPIEWLGVDRSQAMLTQAARKLPAARLQQADATRLPFPDHSVDYLACNFAFHHFEAKDEALNEVFRVLRPGGAFRLRNLLPEQMPDFWIYRAFPESIAIDARRFWPLAKLEGALCRRGALLAAEIHHTRRQLPPQEVRAIARSRDVSELLLLKDEDYARGCARLEARMAKYPRQALPDELALITLRGKLIP